MSNRIHALAQQLTKKATIEECSLEELQHLVKRYPYFAPAQFLLLQKLKQSGDVNTEQQERKAILFYHDPLLFDYFISSDRFYTEEATLFDDKVETQENELIGDIDFVAEEAKPSSESLSTSEDELVVTEPQDVAISHIEDTPLHTSDVETPSEPELSQITLQTESTKTETEQQPSTKEENSLAQLEVTQTSTETQKVELTFEPYHTVDYFASQGIKISQEELPKDKLGKQLKSFTEWLKTMKRLPTTQTAANVEASAEKKVESMADRSISESDVITEAMAEVWAKQGATVKAEETYNKLSLLNPSKRAYFAAKIENLKHS